MAPPLNTKTLSLCSLVSLLLFLHVYGSCAREMKEVEELPKQNEVSHNQPYQASYFFWANDQKETGKPYNFKGVNQPYITGYINGKKMDHPYLISHRHSQKDQKEKTEPYTTSYGNTKRENQPYITGYINRKKANSPYLGGYRHSQKDLKGKNEHYVTAYGGSKREDQPCITVDGNDKKVSQSYLTGYLHSHNVEKEKDEPYMTGYGASKRENQPYKTAYSTGKIDSEGENPKESYVDGKQVSQSYLTGYLHSHNVKKDKDEPYMTSYGASKRENQPYKTAYSTGKIDSEGENPTESCVDGKKVSQSYLTGYLHSHNVKKDKDESYMTGYGASKRENQLYTTAYSTGKKDSEGENPKESHAATYAKDSKDSYAAAYALYSKDSYAATYRKEGSRKTDASSNKADHTEAFKAGFFALDDLYVGNRMTLQFPIEEFPHFLTRKESDSIPFSTSQLTSVLQLLSVPQDSAEAQAMRGTLEQCELQPLTAERKVCVSSLESMIDFIRSIIGSDSQLDILTTTLPATSSVPLQNLTVLEISPDIYAPKWVACHPLPYPYAVFYCHFIGSGTKIFKVKLGSENGEHMEAVGVCHLDTSEWSPDHILFEQLGFKPGEAPVCHFFPVNHLMWIPLPSEAIV